MKDVIAQYTGIFYMPYISWVVLGVASAMALFKYNYYTLWAILIVGVISMIKLILCMRNSPDYIVEIYKDNVVINSEKSSENIKIIEIDCVIKKWNGAVIVKTDGGRKFVSSFYFSQSDDISSFVSTTNKLVDEARLDQDI